MNMTRTAFLFALAGMAAVPAVAQSGKKGEAKERTVEGTVIDAAGKPVPRAIVQLKNVRTAQIRSFIAQDKGEFFFSGLNPDIDYEVRAESDGNSSQTKTLSSYDSRARFIVVLKLSK